MDIIKSIEHEQLKSKVPDIKVGDTIRVHQRIKEGNRERIQVFEGIVIKKQNGGLNETFTVRRVAYGVGVEKTFLLHSPLVEKVELVRVGKVRRAKLYYLRDRIGKAAKTKENIGADLNRDDIMIKEDMPVEESPAKDEEVSEEVKAEETTDVKEEIPAEEIKVSEETTPAEEEKTEEVKEETASTEEKSEEAPIEETKTEEKVEEKSEESEVKEEN